MRRSWLTLLTLAGGLAAGCGPGEDPASGRVVLYTSVDAEYVQGLFATFEEQTGLRVDVLGDTEATKAVGIAGRLLREREHPRADVFWNSEFTQTVRLAEQGLFEPYVPPTAAGMDPRFSIPGERRWTCVLARARVLVVNRDRLGDREPPMGLEDLVSPAWRGEGVMARPVAGSTLTHAAALFDAWGEEKAQAFFRKVKESNLALAVGNAEVVQLVSEGAYTFGLTDTDDLAGALRRGAPVMAVFPDQDGLGTLVFPGTVSLVANAPHPEAARRLVDHIASAGLEAEFARGPMAEFPLHREVKGPREYPPLSRIRSLPLDLADVGARVTDVSDWLRELFAQ